MNDERPGEADALPHAAGQLARIGGFEAVEADEIDGLRARESRISSRQAQRFEADLHVFKHGQPGNSAKLWKTMATPGGGPLDGVAEVNETALGSGATSPR